VAVEITHFHLAILQARVGISWVLRDFEKDIIHECGVGTVNGNYRWRRIIGYR